MTGLTKLYYIIAVTLFFAALPNAQAQKCNDYEKKCQSAPKSFKQSSLSRAFAIRKMKKVRISTTLFGGREYYLSFCGRGKLGNIHIRMISDDGTHTVLYDNATDDFETVKLFEIEETVKVFIEITAPHFFADNEFECAGINISFKPKSN